MNKKIICFAAAAALVCAATNVAQGQVAAGGNYTITQSVIASGGGQNSSGGTFSVDGTTGQNIAGNASTNSPFTITSGFWNVTTFAPTAANVNISGQVKTAGGSGIRNVIVILNSQNGVLRSTKTGIFGYFKFENIEVGGTYIISVSAKRYTFTQPTIVRSVLEEVTDLEFIANDQ